MANTYTTCARCGGLLQVTGPPLVTGPGRCDRCGFHVDTQGHRDGCHAAVCAPVRTKVQRLAQEWRALAELPDDPVRAAHMMILEEQIDALDTAPPRLLDAALGYAALGWPVFPLRARAKVPATRHGFKDATTDLDRIRGWWTRHPDHNIGLPTGHAFDVIDVDPPAGALSYHQLVTDGEIPDIHGHVATASGGLHLYIPAAGDGNRAGLRPGIDYRGAGGYVVAPPSTLGPRGRAWTWVTKPSPTITTTSAAAVAA